MVLVRTVVGRKLGCILWSHGDDEAKARTCCSGN